MPHRPVQVAEIENYCVSGQSPYLTPSIAHSQFNLSAIKLDGIWHSITCPKSSRREQWRYIRVDLILQSLHYTLAPHSVGPQQLDDCKEPHVSNLMLATCHQIKFAKRKIRRTLENSKLGQTRHAIPRGSLRIFPTLAFVVRGRFHSPSWSRSCPRRTPV